MYAADAIHPNMDLQEKLLAIYEFRGGPKVDLTIRKPYLDLLAALGNPHLNLPPVIHVAGTNGKGSVIAMLRAVFEEAGYNVHTYTSPHLIRFNERIVIAGRQIDDEMLEAVLDETWAANQDGEVTFFEFTTAMAFRAFTSHKADICLLETGLGGRLDCTNVVPTPLATIITPISFDHMEFLGQSIREIAGEKAGIMKKDVPCILAAQEYKEAYAVMEEKALQTGCPVIRAETPDDLPPLGLTGAHQKINAAAVITTLKQINGFTIDSEAINSGLLKARWPCRLQQITGSWDAKGNELWIDGGHNEAAGRVIAAQLKHWKESDSKKTHLIMGMMDRKDPKAFLEPILPYLDAITFAAAQDEHALSAEDLKAKTLPNSDLPCGSLSEQTEILTLLESGRDTRTLVAGSLYLAGEVLKLLEN